MPRHLTKPTGNARPVSKRTGLLIILPALLLVSSCDNAGNAVTSGLPTGSEMVAELAKLPVEVPSPVNSPASPAVPLAIKDFCSDCHALPRAESFERDVWYQEIRQGYEFYARSGSTDLNPPPLENVLQYYRAVAPERIEFVPPPAVDSMWLARFTTTKLDWKDADYITPGISSIAWIELLSPGVSHLLVSDMRDGSLSLVNPDPQKTTRNVIGKFSSPAKVTPVDFDGDGWRDLVVSDLGSLKPFDHELGKVVLLRRQVGTLEFEPITLCENLGRVADCAVGNFRGDRQLDLVVAEFGHRRGGSIRLLTNRTESMATPRFDQQILDLRPGTIRVAAHDWNEDGRLDFAAILSQEYEAVELFINRDYKFDAHNIFLGPDLAYGSVGMEPVDLDQDGDLDLLQVNGDCFDNNYANRSHGLSWHENTGSLKFVTHRLIDMPGAYRALPGDMDGDGDLDIVLVANLPTAVKPLSLRESEPVAIMVLEQTSKLAFTPHVLERGTARYPALEVADFNSDGKLDFAVGAQLFDSDALGTAAAKLPRLTVWWQL